MAKKSKNLNLGTLRNNYLEYLELEQGKSQRTLENYRRYLDRFLRWAKITHPQEITQEVIRKYRLYLNRLANQKNKPFKASTKNYHLIALRGFLRYLAKQDIKSLAPEKIELVKAKERQIEILSPDEIKRLLEAPLAKGKALRSLRDYAILEVLFSTGLRVSELCNLNRENIDLKKGEFGVLGKGGKVRLVFLSEKAKKALKDYLTKRTDPDPAVFIRIKKGPPSPNLRLTPRSVQRIVEKWRKAAGIVKRVHPHSLRHAFATDLLAAGADIRAVQELLGHANISTTQIYTHLTNPQLKSVHQKYHGKSLKK